MKEASTSATPNLDALHEEAERLMDLLNDPQPGLFGWREFLRRSLQAIAEYAPAPEINQEVAMSAAFLDRLIKEMKPPPSAKIIPFQGR